LLKATFPSPIFLPCCLFLTSGIRGTDPRHRSITTALYPIDCSNPTRIGWSNPNSICEL
jgi:hypothetical protein